MRPNGFKDTYVHGNQIYLCITYCENLDCSRSYSRYNAISAADTGLSCRVQSLHSLQVPRHCGVLKFLQTQRVCSVLKFF